MTSKKRAYLKNQAHSLKVNIIIGKNGCTNNLIQAIIQEFKNKELIKIKFNDFKDEKKELTELIQNETTSFLVSIIGNCAIFFKKLKK